MSKPKDGASFYRQYNKSQREEAERQKIEAHQQTIRKQLGLGANRIEQRKSDSLQGGR